MGIIMKGIEIDNFKSYNEMQCIQFSDLSVLLGANSSGKSTALQALLAIKQTMECNSPDEELLLSGQYVALGDFDDVISNNSRPRFMFKVLLEKTNKSEVEQDDDAYNIAWSFGKGNDGTSAILQCLDINYENISISMRRTKKTFHSMYINNIRTPYSVEISNLLFKSYYIHFDTELNKKAIIFVNSILKSVISSKTSTFSMDEPLAYSGIDEFYIKLLGLLQTIRNKEEISIDSKRPVAKRIVKVLDDFCELQLHTRDGLRSMPIEYRLQFLTICLSKYDDISSIEILVKNFETYLDEYKKKKSIVDEYTGIYCVGSRIFGQPYVINKGESDSLTQIKYTLDFYDSFHSDIVNKIFFVGPIRENPKGLYNIGFERIPKYVGPTGSYFASVLLHENKKEREYILPTGKERCTLSDALAEWMMHLNIASSVDVDKKNSFGFSVSIENLQQVKSDIMNVGIGTSQVLPVLISVLLSEPGEILLFEQPELHLHPYSQSGLADLFVAYCKEGRKVVIETHSEYFLLRLRYHIVKNDYYKENVEVNFFHNQNGTHVESANISGLGNIEYPKDFHDETQELLNSILEAALERKGFS